MTTTGPQLIQRICNARRLTDLDNCVAVPSQLSQAVYGRIQDDVGIGTRIQRQDCPQSAINAAVSFGGSNGETAVWHFLVHGNVAVHHFAVIPWYRHAEPHGQAYTIFMAYEGRAGTMYTVGDYVGGRRRSASQAGYAQQRDATQFAAMLKDLLTDVGAWERYFGQVGMETVQTIQYWKYRPISLDAAIARV